MGIGHGALQLLKILCVFLYNEQQQQSLIKEIKDSELVYLEHEQSVLLRLKLTTQRAWFLLQGIFFFGPL